MTLATMADRSLPLAERVQAALLCWDMDDAREAVRAALLADVAAADRLARALDQLDGSDTDDHDALEGAWDEYREARLAYRARMQVVARG